MAGAALSWCQVLISLQAQGFRKVRYRWRGRRAFRGSASFLAGLGTGSQKAEANWHNMYFSIVKSFLTTRALLMPELA